MSEYNIKIPNGYKVTIKIEVEDENKLRKALYMRPDMRPKYYHDDLFYIDQLIKRCVNDIENHKRSR